MKITKQQIRVWVIILVVVIGFGIKTVVTSGWDALPRYLFRTVPLGMLISLGVALAFMFLLYIIVWIQIKVEKKREQKKDAEQLK